MQVDCYKRNFGTEVCIEKCQFFDECDRHYSKDRRAANALRDKMRAKEIREKMRKGAFK